MSPLRNQNRLNNDNKISLCGSHHCISMHGTSSEEQDLSMHTIILSFVFIFYNNSELLLVVNRV